MPANLTTALRHRDLPTILPLWVEPSQAVASSQERLSGCLLIFGSERQLYAREAPYDVDLRRRAAGQELPVGSVRFPVG
jgi:hypothetical protein